MYAIFELKKYLYAIRLDVISYIIDMTIVTDKTYKLWCQ